MQKGVYNIITKALISRKNLVSKNRLGANDAFTTNQTNLIKAYEQVFWVYESTNYDYYVGIGNGKAPAFFMVAK